MYVDEEIVLTVGTGGAGFQPEPGSYIVKIEKIEKIATRIGDALRIWAKSSDWSGSWGFVVSLRLSKKSRLGQLMSAAGVVLSPGEKIDVKGALEGKAVGISVYRDAKGWARPSGFFPATNAPF
jgi:hypothetical protein